MKNDFLIAFWLTLGHEGTYSNDPRDGGGETWMGIARNKNPFWPGWTIIDRIKRSVAWSRGLVAALNEDDELFDLVKALYRKNYWDSLKLDDVLFQDIANEMFDTGVNQGTGTAGKYLQMGLNLLNCNQKYYKNISEDGQVGKNTLTALKSFFAIPGRSEERNLKTILTVLNGLQFSKYKDICDRNEGQEIYFYGWLNRVS